MTFSMLSPFSLLAIELILVPHGAMNFSVGVPIYTTRVKVIDAR